MKNIDKIKSMNTAEMASFLKNKNFTRYSDLKEWLESEVKEYKQLNYSMYCAYDNGVNEHPQVQMDKLGYKVIGAVAQSLYDSWWFTVEEYIEPLPP